MPSINAVPISIPIDSNSRYYHKTLAIGKIIKLRNKPRVQIMGSGTKTKLLRNTHMMSNSPIKVPIDEKNYSKFNPKLNIAGIFIRTSEDTVLTNVRIPVKGNIIKSNLPIIYKSLPPSMKDHTVFSINNLDEKTGMSSSYILRMIKDKNGCLWIGTNGQGAIWYDGNNYRFFNKESGLNGGFIHSLIADSKNNIWFGTDKGVSCYDGNNFLHFSEKEGLLNDNVRSVFEDHSGNIWFGTNEGLSKFDGSSFIHYTKNEGLSDNIIRYITEDKKYNLWIGTLRGGITIYDGKSFSHLNESTLSNYPVRCITQDNKNNIWIGSQGGGVIKYDGKYLYKYSEIQGLKDNTVRSIFESKSGKIWFGTEAGLSVFDGTLFTHYTENEGLSNNTIQFIWEDNRNQFWVGSFGGGLINFDLNGFSYLPFNSIRGQNNLLVWSIFQDREENMWFGTDNEGVSKFRDNEFFHYTTKDGLGDNTIYSIFQDREGSIWLGTGLGGVNKISRHENRVDLMNININEGLNDNLIWDIYQDVNDDFWFGTDHGGVSCYKDSFFLTFTEIEGLSNNTCNCIIKDQFGRFWFGTYGGGVTIYDGKSFSYFSKKEGLGNDNVYSIIQDTKGRIWIGTDGGGVTCIENGFYINFTVKEGLSNNSVFSLKEDNKGNIWVGTGKGLNLIYEIPYPDSIIDVKSNNFRIYNWKNELKGEDFAQNSVLIDKNNMAWWGTSKGVLKLDLNNFEIPNQIPIVFLRQLNINNKHYDYRQQDEKQKNEIKYDAVVSFENYPLSPKLNYRNNHLTFFFSAIYWESPQRIKYSYTLEGHEQVWSDPTADDKVDYRNLSPGNYIFKVKAIGISQKWSEPFEYTFTILPPWWKTWWAYFLYFLTFSALILVIISYRSIALKRENRILESKVNHRTIQLEKKSNELEKSLGVLKSTQSQLIQSEKMVSLGEITAGIAHEIQNPLNFVNNFADINKELISEMKIEIKHGNLEQINLIAETIEENEAKINIHGKRVENIVKSMLQHSRNARESAETQVLTNINALIEEYIRLSYNGLKIKDKFFTAEFRTELDVSIPDIMIIPQEMGRVLLNLFSNAFYAVSEKANLQHEFKSSYKPIVWVTSKLLIDNFIEIRVMDNGNGVPQNIIDKIFQPFFTTKPTGQGTGLGLSMAYDIITKVHGGTIKVDSKAGEGAVFIINFPFS